MLFFFQQVVELNGYVIIVVESRDGKIKLYGSPADKDNLEVGDEILDVNERKLEDLSRAEVIRYIHEVFTSKKYLTKISEHFQFSNFLVHTVLRDKTTGQALQC